jgi:DnaJ-class molecular chaperone
MAKGKENEDNDQHGNPKRGDSPKKLQCGVCHGTGTLGDSTCWNCGGEGEL